MLIHCHDFFRATELTLQLSISLLLQQLEVDTVEEEWVILQRLEPLIQLLHLFVHEFNLLQGPKLILSIYAQRFRLLTIFLN